MIRVKAIAIIPRGADVLLSFAIDPDTGFRYGRFLGGGIEPGERAEETIRRELREELGVEVDVVARLGEVTNSYQHGGRTYHEAIVVCRAAFANRATYEREFFPVNEAVCDGPAQWVSVDALRRGEIPVYPPELLDLI